MIILSRIKSIDEKSLEGIVKSSYTVTNVLKSLGYKNTSSILHTELKKRLDELNISYGHFSRHSNFRKKLSDCDAFTDNSTYSRCSLKKRIIKNNLIEYKCHGENCNVSNTWNGNIISLHLEHKNGINNDNRLENLTFLCPNCHSQTVTYSGKNRPKRNAEKTIFKCECGNKKRKGSYTCKKCYVKILIRDNSLKNNRPTKDELIEKFKENNSFVRVGKNYNVSDNAVRNWCKNYGILDFIVNKEYLKQ
jgi:hypothetical protein